MLPTIQVEGEGRAYARLYGFVADTWLENHPPPATADSLVNVYITALPFAIGACRAAWRGQDGQAGCSRPLR